MKRKIRREKGDRWCEIEIELKDGRLSVCGSEGSIVKLARAKKDALEYWVQFFRDDPDQIHDMNKRCGKHFRSPLSAARFVVASDGELHGLDVHAQEGDKVYVMESCGQIREEIAEWFPEARPLLAWHLNDLKAGCEHQEALGWGRGKTIALAPDDLTDAQRDSLASYAEAQVKPARDRMYEEEKQALMKRYGTRILTGKDLAEVRDKVWTKIKPAPFKGALYEDSLCAPCPTCGYRYGTAWLKRELPTEIITLAETVCADERAA